MSRETGIWFDSVGISDDGCDCVMILRCYPWENTARERSLGSYEEVDAVIKPYADELGIDVSNTLELCFTS